MEEPKDMTALEVNAWLWRVALGNKAKAASLAGVSRSWLDKALEEGADLKHANALRGCELRTAQERATKAVLDFVDRQESNARVMLHVSGAPEVRALIDLERLNDAINGRMERLCAWNLEWSRYEEIACDGDDLSVPRRACLAWGEPRTYRSLLDDPPDGAMHVYPEDVRTRVRQDGALIRVGKGEVLLLWLDDSDDWI